MEDWVLLCHIFQCKDLPASDKNGLADPYINIYCSGVEVSTKNKPREQTLNPRWYETYPLAIRTPSIEDAAPIIIYVFDYDAITSDDMMGRALITMTDASMSTDSAPRPKWYSISLGREGTEKGEILCSFTLARPNAVPRFNILPQFIDKTVEINILGLRGLKPAVGFLPVNKAFVRVDLNSLDLPDVSQGIKFLQTQPFEGGSDPNINSTLSFRCKIPEDPLYAPVLTCTVCDYLFAGLSQPLIGTFSIDLGKYVVQRASQKSKKLLDTMLKLRPNMQLEEEKVSAIAVPDKKFEQEGPKFESVDLGDETDADHKQEFKHLIPADPQANNSKFYEDLSKAVVLIEEAMNGKIRVEPQYKEAKSKKLMEIYPPNPDHYLEVGYSREPNDGLKHYRYYVHEELEKISIFGNSAFEEFDILKGQSRGVDDLPSINSHQDKAGQSSTLETVGKFKALIRVVDYPQKWSPFSKLTGLLGDQPNEDNDFEEIARNLLTKTKCVVRVYVIDAFDLEQKDSFSKSDPYFKLKLGGRVIDTQDMHQEDVCDPKFNKVYDFETTIPGQSLLKLSMWDYNKVFPDSKIGTTVIDIEDRFFNKS